MEEYRAPNTDNQKTLIAPLIEEASLLDDEYAEVLLNHLAALDLKSFYPEDFDINTLGQCAAQLDSNRQALPLVLSIRMLGLLRVQSRMRVLEIGSGNGLICAVLSRLGAEVFGVEHVAPLVQRARKNLDKHSYEGVLLRRGSSASGWDDYAPYDRILVSSTLRHQVDKKLLDQLDPHGGRLVALEFGKNGWKVTLYEAIGGNYNKTSFESVSID
jgi:protein-L-isoaspartate(D-aspartate) O-methyltransferase